MKKAPLDPDGQPLNRNLSTKRLADRTIDELIGLCKGIQADSVVTESEVRFLADWLEQNRAIIDIWPANILARRIEKILEDDIVDDAEQKELFELLCNITGCTSTREVINKNTGEVIENISHLSTQLPLDNPAPSVIFEEKSFCLTGKFFFGPRKICEAQIKDKGGKVQSSPTHKTDFIVIGVLGSTDWKHSTHGNKIMRGVELKENGLPISIITEEHWATHL